ncbi:MAG: LssY C-terminal domain-containing protein [Candidatus Saccharimonadales bacterium]
MVKQKIRIYVEASIVAFWTLLKRLTIGAILFVIGWLAYSEFAMRIMHGGRMDQAIGFIGLWLILAYVFIPRLHRILTKLYIPDYFIGRIRTSDGLLSDPVNLAFIGGEINMHEAMQKAGWVLADKLSVKSSIMMVIATVFRRSYPTAPVSNAYLFGNLQSFTYQQDINGKTNARHHVRFWKTPDGWIMPGGHKVDWVAAGTFDRAIGISYFTLQLTHKIASDTDIERDYIVKTIEEHSKPKEIKVIKNYFSAYHHRSGGGDSIMTDGALPIIRL